MTTQILYDVIITSYKGISIIFFHDPIKNAIVYDHAKIYLEIMSQSRDIGVGPTRPPPQPWEAQKSPA